MLNYRKLGLAHRISILKMVDQAVGDSMSNDTGRRVLSKQYGVKQFMGS
jgi:hypothetical protein